MNENWIRFLTKVYLIKDQGGYSANIWEKMIIQWKHLKRKSRENVSNDVMGSIFGDLKSYLTAR